MVLLGLAPAWRGVSERMEPVRPWVPEIVRLHGSDALFAASVALFLGALWGRHRPVLVSGLAFVLALEALQATDFVPGTFDVRDLLAEAAAYAVMSVRVVR